MSLEIEVRSSGWGPRLRHVVLTRDYDAAPGLVASGVVGERWTRMGLDRKGRNRLLGDGVAITIRRAG